MIEQPIIAKRRPDGNLTVRFPVILLMPSGAELVLIASVHVLYRRGGAVFTLHAGRIPA